MKDHRFKGLKWLSPKKSPFSVNGFYWFNEEKLYRRLPKHPAWKTSADVEILANNTAGGQISFKSNTGKLAIRVKLLGPHDFYHLAPTGQCGFDCYTGRPGKMSYISTAVFDHDKTAYESILFNYDDKKTRDITLNFPLYQGVREVLVGVDPGAKILKPAAYKNNKKIVIYGTSITQGGCAGRPGLAYSNILSRRFNYEFINLGFSGSGRGEPEMAMIISEIKDPLCFILDYEANSLDKLRVTLPSFIRLLRARHPNVPIISITGLKFCGEQYRQWEKLFNERRKIQKDTIESRRRNGDKNLYLVDGYTLWKTNVDEGTVDGCHPNDLGFMNMANSLEPILKRILKL